MTQEQVSPLQYKIFCSFLVLTRLIWRSLSGRVELLSGWMVWWRRGLVSGFLWRHCMFPGIRVSSCSSKSFAKSWIIVTLAIR